MTERDKSDAPSTVDAPTIAAIAIVVYAVSNFAHEGLGHGVACYLLGGKVNYISTAACACDAHTLALWWQRLINAAGTLVNLCLGLLAYGLLRSLRPSSSASLRFFLWLGMALNLFQAGGYLMVPTLIGFGDWLDFLTGLTPHWPIRIGLIAIGVVISFWGLSAALREFEPFLDANSELRRRRALQLTLIPYFTGGILYCVAGLFNPEGMILIALSSAASSFGGAAFLAWMTACLRPKPLTSDIQSPLSIPRNVLWLVAGAVAAVVFVLVLGPSVKFTR